MDANPIPTTPGSPTQQQSRHLDDLLDKALADTFPASDPVSSLGTDDPETPAEPAQGASDG
jgi:hypothetical protein